MVPVENSPHTLKRHILRTYLNLRVGISLIGLSLPLVLWLGGKYHDSMAHPLLGSMSLYYFTTMRNPFVGGLVAIGAFLCLYKGFSRREDWLLNAAGVLAVCVAFMPTRNALLKDLPDLAWYNVGHVTAAILFFVCIAVVCLFLASDTLPLVRDAGKARTMLWVYRVLGVLMILLPSAAYALGRWLIAPGGENTGIFLLETAAVWVFSIYWSVKSYELATTEADQAAQEGKLARARFRPRNAPGKLVQTAPLAEDIENVEHDASLQRFSTRG